MKRMLGYARKANDDFGLIEPGDTVLVGVSGGKDSLVLLRTLALYRHFAAPFTLQAATLTMGIEPFDVSGIAALCKELDVPYHVRHTQIGRIVFEERKEKNPCSLCANMRRGALNDLAVDLGCNKVALGHHRDDAIETLLLSLFYEGRLHTFLPKTYLSRKNLTLIRPLVYAPEHEVIACARRYALPVVTNPCPANGHTKRQEVKDLLGELEQRYPDIRGQVLRALQNKAQYGLWD